VTLSFAATARCELITVEFSGTVTSVSVDRDYQSYDFPDIGDPFTGLYRFDSNAPDTAASPEAGGFTTSLSNTALGVSIGEFRFAGRAIAIGTFQNYYEVGDWLPSIELTSDPALAQLLERNQLALVIRRENLFQDPNILPLTPPSLVGADQASLAMHMDDRNDLRPGSEVTIVATLESLRIVPEPFGAVLFGIGLLLLLPIRKHRLPGRQS
jgi:hypothetical protein